MFKKLAALAFVLLFAICFSCAASAEAAVCPENATHEVVVAPGKAATCTEKGLTDGVWCTICGTLYGQKDIPAVGHKEVDVPGKAATCTEKGLTDGKFCTVCNAFTVNQKDIPAAGHTEVDVPGKAATCTEKGLTDGKYCTVCNAFTVNQKDIPAAGHTEVDVPGKAATCTEKGLTDGKYCTVCNAFTVNQKDIPAEGHNEVTMPGKAATCTEKGYTEYVVCTTCNNIVKHGSDIPALGHTEVTMPGKAATCTEKGYTEYVVCTTCNQILVHGSDIPAVGHTEKTMPGKDATCTEKGYTEYVVCTTCNQILVHGSDIPAAGHNFVDGNCACGAENPDYVAPKQPEASELPTRVNIMTSFGLSISELVANSDDTAYVTPIDLSVDGEYTYALVSDNNHVIGAVVIKIENGMMTIAYELAAEHITVKNETLKIYASKADLAADNGVDAVIGAQISISDNFGEDSKVIISLVLEGNYDANGENVTTLEVDEELINELSAIVD